MPTEAWSSVLSFAGGLLAALLAIFSARSLKKEDLTATNLKSLMESWDAMAVRFQQQIEYRDRQLAQYQAIIEKLRDDRNAQRVRLDECERGRIDLYYEVNRLRRAMGLPEIEVPAEPNVEAEPPLDPGRLLDPSATC